MLVQTVSVSVKRTVNLGDYNSVTLESAAWVAVEEGDDPQEVLASGYRIVRQSMAEVAAEMGLTKSQAVTVTRKYQGLVVEDGEEL